VWQALYEELADRGFMVIAVAMDSRPGDALPWIEAARPTYPALIDRDHRLAELAAVLGRPFAVDVPERVAYLGAAAADRAGALTSLMAPDFSLPDLQGRLHSLSEHRGKKVFLVAYASW